MGNDEMSKEKNRRKNQKLLDKASLLQSSIDLADHILREARRLLPLLLIRGLFTWPSRWTLLLLAASQQKTVKQTTVVIYFCSILKEGKE